MLAILARQVPRIRANSSHAAVISLSSKDSEGTIKLSRSAEGKDVILQVSTGPRVSGAYSISSIQTVGEAEAIPKLQYAKPLTTNSRKTQAQTPRGVTVGTLKGGPPLRVGGDRGQPTGAPPPPPLF
eukprot:scaffold16000_cov101-Isochrysis_galbana.AAC.1